MDSNRDRAAGCRIVLGARGGWGAATAVALLLAAAACSEKGGAQSRPAAGEDEEAALRQAFEAIAAGDFAAFQRSAVTSADIGMGEAKLGRGSGSYAAGSLKNTQVQKQKEQFERAVAGGAGQIDFKSSRFVGAGTLVSSGAEQALPQGSYPFDIYSLVVEKGGSSFDTKELTPRFKMAKWNGEWRVMRLVYE
jgi:hypothetical protein